MEAGVGLVVGAVFGAVAGILQGEAAGDLVLELDDEEKQALVEIMRHANEEIEGQPTISDTGEPIESATAVAPPITPPMLAPTAKSG